MQKPELHKKYVFLAKCIENAVLSSHKLQRFLLKIYCLEFRSFVQTACKSRSEQMNFFTPFE